MLHGGGQLLHSEHEAAVAVDRYHRPGRIRDLDAERGHIAEAEVVLIAARDIGARLVHREAEAGDESDLADLFDEEAVARQYRADRVQEGELRLHHLELAPGTRLEILEFRFPGRTLAQARRERLEERAHSEARVGHHADLGRAARHLRRVYVDAHDPQLRRHLLPADELQLHARADR